MWEAQIKVGKTHKYLGLYKTPKEAGEAYQRAAKELHGDFYREELEK